MPSHGMASLGDEVRKKHSPAFRVKVAQTAIQVVKPSIRLKADSRSIPTGITPGKERWWKGRQAYLPPKP